MFSTIPIYKTNAELTCKQKMLTIQRVTNCLIVNFALAYQWQQLRELDIELGSGMKAMRGETDQVSIAVSATHTRILKVLSKVIIILVACQRIPT